MFFVEDMCSMQTGMDIAIRRTHVQIEGRLGEREKSLRVAADLLCRTERTDECDNDTSRLG